jgi:hypothetical protein
MMGGKTGTIGIEREMLIDRHLLGSSYAPSQLANSRIARPQYPSPDVSTSQGGAPAVKPQLHPG